MTMHELLEKTQAELSALLAEKRDGLRSLRFKVAHGEHAHVRDIRAIRLEIARLLTALTQKGKKA